MSQVVHAIYENGVLRPTEQLDLEEHERVRVTVEPTGPPAAADAGGLLPDPLAGVRVATGIPDLAERFDDYRFGTRRP